jgi:GrpB-like predicted nucleotidyltransferase (UPF0157 family)
MARAVIVDYDPGWPVRAERYLGEVRSALGSLDGAQRFGYEHIGSTAVPGLAAKPVVDLQVRMPALPSLDELAGLLGATPFVPAPGSRPDSPGVYRDHPRPGHPRDPALYGKRLFHAPEDGAILHIRRADSPFGRFVVDFRDWLCTHPERARRYAEIKRGLADLHANDADYDDYTRAKTAFFDEIQPELNDWVRTRAAR